MNEKNSFDNMEIALHAITDLEFRESKEFQDWLLDEKNKALFEKLSLEVKGTLDLLSDQGVENEWINVKLAIRRKRIRYVIKTSVSVAAILLFVIAGTFWLDSGHQIRPEVTAPEYVAKKEVMGITIQVDNHRPILIGNTSQNIEDTGSMAALEKLKALPANLLSIIEASSKKEVHQMVISVPRGETYRFRLGDGTEVCLNAESKLRYSVPFAGDKRVVELEGEGYFKVTKDQERPFYVRTQYLTTRVLGTEFNVRSYYRDDASVTLVRGGVAVSNGSSDVYLHPGQNVRIDDSGLTVSTVDVKQYNAWVDHYFYFDQVSLKDIMKELGRWYNVNIEFADPEAAVYKFRYWADKRQGIQDAIDIMNRVGKVSIVLQKDKAIIRKYKRED